MANTGISGRIGMTVLLPVAAMLVLSIIMITAEKQRSTELKTLASLAELGVDISASVHEL